MKIIAFIMAFVILALTVMPCADQDNAENDSRTKTELSKSNQQKDSPQQDDCSPFCHCTCCAGFSINHFIASISYLSPYQGKAVPAYLPSAVIEIALPIWQPPKLV